MLKKKYEKESVKDEELQEFIEQINQNSKINDNTMEIVHTIFGPNIAN